MWRDDLGPHMGCYRCTLINRDKNKYFDIIKTALLYKKIESLKR